MPRIELTRQLFGSPESGRLRVGGWYVALLGHPPAARRCHLLGGRLRTVDDLDVEATLVASAEYPDAPRILSPWRRTTSPRSAPPGGRRQGLRRRPPRRLPRRRSPSTGGLDVQLFDLATLRPGDSPGPSAWRQGSTSPPTAAPSRSRSPPRCWCRARRPTRSTSTRSTSHLGRSPASPQATTSAYAPSLSTDGRVLAFGSNESNLVPGDTNDDGDIFVVTIDAAGVPLDTRLVPGVDGHWPAVSADGSTLAIAGFNDVRRIDLEDPDLASEVVGDDADDVAVSADGSRLLFDDGDGLVSWVEGTPSPVTLPVPGRVGHSLALSDDGGTFASRGPCPWDPAPPSPVSSPDRRTDPRACASPV